MYITLVELRQSDYEGKAALVNFISGRLTTVDQLSDVKIGHLPKNMYSIKACIRGIQERIIAANNKKPSWIRYIPTWEKHIAYLESLKTKTSKYHK